MKVLALAIAGLMTFGTLPAEAHHREERSESVVPYIVGGTILGGLLYFGTRDRGNYHHHHRDHYHHHHRRNRRARVIDEYRYRGDNYRVCRRGNQVFYC